MKEPKLKIGKPFRWALSFINSRAFFAGVATLAFLIFVGLLLLWIWFWTSKEVWWGYLIGGSPIIAWIYWDVYRKNP